MPPSSPTGATVALVGLDGGIYWLCLPRFDSEPVFCGLLDRDRGGHFTITPDGLTEARQRYEPDTGVLVTELRSPTGLVRLTDALALRSGADLTDDVPGGRGELVRSAVVLDGSVRLRGWPILAGVDRIMLTVMASADNR